MRNIYYLDIRNSLLISFLIHMLIFFLSPSPRKRAVYSVPRLVELVTVKAEQAEQKKIQIPKKIVKKKETVRKEEKSPEKTVRKEIVTQETTSLMVNTRDFPFPYYINMVKEKVSAHWNPPGISTGRKCTVYFKIMRNGEVSGAYVDQSSGSSPLDQAGLRAILRSDPFPPLPEEYEEAYLGIFFGFKTD